MVKIKIILSIFVIVVSLQPVFAVNSITNKYYNNAYFEICNMLEGRIPLSIKRAVFMAEWAYLDGDLDFERDFCEPIKRGADYLKRMIAVNNWEKYKTAKQIALCNFFFYPCSGNGQNPFKYDFSKEYPEDDWRYQLVSRTIRTHRGQCHSLPWGVSTPQNLFSNQNLIGSFVNPELMATVYALGRVDMILTNRERGTVKIVNNNATDYDWNLGGGSKRDSFIRINNALFNINPQIHGFKTYYYGIGVLRK
ncbi:MAG: hypothetical protein IJ698_00740 [Prevotella sp.]|nr:hypothetical protein [Prevotella sp.]